MDSLQGHLLIASPKLIEPTFCRTVTLIVQHDGEDGALGLVLNRATDTSIREVWQHVSESPCERDEFLHMGGPCEGTLMVLHDDADVSEIEVQRGVHFSAQLPNVEWLLEHYDGPLRVFVGYAGWSPGQLEDELASGAWLVLRATVDDVFGRFDDQWDHVTDVIERSEKYPGIDPRLIPEDPSHN